MLLLPDKLIDDELDSTLLLDFRKLFLDDDDDDDDDDDEVELSCWLLLLLFEQVLCPNMQLKLCDDIEFGIQLATDVVVSESITIRCWEEFKLCWLLGLDDRIFVVGIEPLRLCKPPPPLIEIEFDVALPSAEFRYEPAE